MTVVSTDPHLIVTPEDEADAPLDRRPNAVDASNPAASRVSGAGHAPAVVLLDASGRPSAVAAKSEVHNASTPLHLAFSCHVVGPDDRILITRRSSEKRTWPGVWSNACCGHPAPGEDVADGVVRRVRRELGVEPRDVRLALPDFRYRAVAADGIVEHEVCPVYLVELPSTLDPDPAEVAEWAWVSPEAFLDLAASAPFLLSPWSVLQAAEFRRGSALTFPHSASAFQTDVDC